MKIVVGLGNPGREYTQTRHNAGFMVLERLAVRHGLSEPRTKFHAGVLEGRIADDKVLLMQPTTFMNRSGLAVAEASSFYKLSLEDLLVVVDDVALPVGVVRLRGGGSAGGHNGLADIQRAMGTHKYPRLRIGIGAPMIGDRRIPQVDYVLGKFTDEQSQPLHAGIETACDAIESWIRDGLDKTMTRFNTRVETESPPEKQGGNETAEPAS